MTRTLIEFMERLIVALVMGKPTPAAENTDEHRVVAPLTRQVQAIHDAGGTVVFSN